MRIVRSSPVWSVHSHSKFSAKDALPKVADMVARAAEMNQPALGLTDHGNIAGSIQLYKQCKQHNILPFPGTELYVVGDRGDSKAKRHHLTVLAFTTEGYKNLVHLSTLSHKNFHNKPLVDFNDLAQLSDEGLTKGLAGMSGCLSGFVQQALLKSDQQAAYGFLIAQASWFDRFYVELMNHNTSWGMENGERISDDQICEALVGLADKAGLPCVLSQDSHYVGHEDQSDHDAFKRLVSFGPDPDDGVFSGDGFHLADEAWFQAHHGPSRYAMGVNGLQDLLNHHALSIKQLDKYHYNIPFTVDDPQKRLSERTKAELKQRNLGRRYEARLDEELEIIGDTGMAGYLILVAEVTDWCRAHQVVFQARGSAAGSMCCWLLGITPVDPLKWKLSFERFISRDRTKPPDIDLDVEHWRRKELVNWLASRFATSQIGNWNTFKLKGETDPDTGEETGKGALRVQYFARKRQIGEEVGDWASIPDEDKRDLYRLDELHTYKGYGVHAAGILLTTTKQELEELVPQMYVASSKTFISQYDMNDVEELGLVKLDVLGLKTLSVLHRALENMGRPIDLDWIPLADRKTFSTIASGDTDGVFQLEGWTARKGVQKLKPTTVSDVIAAMALFRPATMDSGATAAYIAHKHKTQTPVPRHELLESITKDTQHILLFQEQVISVLRNLGMEPEALTKFLKAVKASNQNIGQAGEVIKSYEEQVHAMAVQAGLSEDDWKWLWEAITGFAAYGFNRAHSTVYGLTAYYCAYLITHFPVEFHGALLAVAASTEKEAKYLTTTRRRGIRLTKADVERSDVTYTVERTRIRKGLTSIKGIGEKAAQAIVDARGDGFVSFHKFVESVDPRKVNGIKPYRESGDVTVGTFGKLYDAGALECFDDTP